eukprot:Trichotokara_eunicae@DN9973_c0_g1_i1.p1
MNDHWSCLNDTNTYKRPLCFSYGCNELGTCREGYEGFLCQKCSSGYGLVSTFCVACGGPIARFVFYCLALLTVPSFFIFLRVNHFHNESLQIVLRIGKLTVTCFQVYAAVQLTHRTW